MNISSDFLVCKLERGAAKTQTPQASVGVGIGRYFLRADWSAERRKVVDFRYCQRYAFSVNTYCVKYFDVVKNVFINFYIFTHLPTHVPIIELPFITKSKFLHSFNK